MPIKVLYSLKWHAHTGLHTANFAWVSEGLGQKTEFRSHQEQDAYLSGEIVIGGTDKNKITLTMGRTNSSDYFSETFIVFQTIGANSPLPDDGICYYGPDGRKSDQKIPRKLDAEKYAFFVTPQDEVKIGLNQSGDEVINLLSNPMILRTYMQNIDVFVINTMVFKSPFVCIAYASMQEYFDFTPVTRNPASIAP